VNVRFGLSIQPQPKALVKPVKTPAEKYKKCLETMREQFRILETSFSPGIRASWLKEVETIRNRAKADP
jgi:hypothetical protein